LKNQRKSEYILLLKNEQKKLKKSYQKKMKPVRLMVGKVFGGAVWWDGWLAGWLVGWLVVGGMIG